MLRFDLQCDPKKISLTGVRAVVILALLEQKPRTFEEIKDFLVSSNLVDREYSIDTIRIDLNTLKYAGCSISRADKRTNNCYVLLSHPFDLTFSDEEVQTLKKVYDSIKKYASVSRLIEYDKLFEKLANSVKNEETKQKLLGISILKGLDKDFIEELLTDANKKSRMTIEYIVDKSRKVKYDITVESLGIRSNKLYVYCFNHAFGKRSFLKFSSFSKILCRQLNDDETILEDFVIEFELKNYKKYTLEKDEKLIESKGNVAKIKGSYFNDFIAMQRMLYFANDCTILSPVDTKEKLVEKLEKMRSLYE